jgi:hypothetical protein
MPADDPAEGQEMVVLSQMPPFENRGRSKFFGTRRVATFETAERFGSVLQAFQEFCVVRHRYLLGAVEPEGLLATLCSGNQK